MSQQEDDLHRPIPLPITGSYYKMNVVDITFFGDTAKIHSIIIAIGRFVHIDNRMISHIGVISFAEFFPDFVIASP